MFQKVVGRLCEKYGKYYNEELMNEMVGLTDRDLSQRLVKKLSLPVSPTLFERELEEMSRKSLPAAPLREGIERLLTHLHKHKVPLAVATNSTERMLRLHLMMRPKLFSLFHHKVCCSDADVLKPKPHPDMYLLAASRFREKPKPAECLVFEDSPIGVEAALAAGMQVVMTPNVPNKHNAYAKRASLVLRSLNDFKPQYFGLPPFPPASKNVQQQS